MTNLKPCPFCGGEAELKDGNLYCDKTFYVKCKNCKAMTDRTLVNHPAMALDGSLIEKTRYTEKQAKKQSNRSMEQEREQ